MGVGKARTEVSAVTANEIVAISYGGDWIEFIYNNPCCLCPSCKNMVSTIYLSIWGMNLCIGCLGVWNNNPGWFDLIALVTEATNGLSVD